MTHVEEAVAAATKIDGWMSEAELQWLATRAAERKIVVEVGSWMGRSAKAMGRVVGETLFCVDHWFEGEQQPKHNQTEWDQSRKQGPDALCGKFVSNVAPEVASGKIRLVRESSTGAARNILKYTGGRRPDMVFIDGCHDYGSVLADIDAWKPVVAPGGLFCGHDYHPNWKGVVRAVDERVKGRKTVDGTVIWMDAVPRRTYVIDLDGTFFRFGTQEPLPSAVETVKRLEAEGHTIAWATLRSPADKALGKDMTEARLRELGIKSTTILWECPSPRVVVNDDGAEAVRHIRNGPLTYEALTFRG